jgi:membrane associated rhomboid family serine protease
MKKIKSYFVDLPNGVKLLITLNLVINLGFISFNYIFNYDLNYIFGAYPTCSDNFDYYRIFTFMFSHSIDITHLLSNVIIFLLFAPIASKEIGFKRTFLLYIISGLTSFIFFNHQKNYENDMIKKDMIKIGVDISKIKQYDNGNIDFSKFKNINEEQYRFLINYPHTNSFLSGSSGSVFSFVILFLLIKTKKRKNIFLIIFGLLLLFNQTLFYFYRDITTSGTTFGHLGGMVGGLTFFIIYLLNKKRG